MRKHWTLGIAAAVLICLVGAALGALVSGPVSNGCPVFASLADCPQVFLANGMAR